MGADSEMAQWCLRNKKPRSTTTMCSRAGTALQGTLAETVSPHRAMGPEELTKTRFISKVSMEHAYTDHASFLLLIHIVAVLGRESRVLSPHDRQMLTLGHRCSVL